MFLRSKFEAGTGDGVRLQGGFDRMPAGRGGCDGDDPGEEGDPAAGAVLKQGGQGASGGATRGTTGAARGVCRIGRGFAEEYVARLGR